VGTEREERVERERCSRPEEPEREEARRADSPPIMSEREPRLEIRTVTY
jgi:hypothetical protein